MLWNCCGNNIPADSFFRGVRSFPVADEFGVSTASWSTAVMTATAFPVGTQEYHSVDLSVADQSTDSVSEIMEPLRYVVLDSNNDSSPPCVQGFYTRRGSVGNPALAHGSTVHSPLSNGMSSRLAKWIPAGGHVPPSNVVSLTFLFQPLIQGITNRAHRSGLRVAYLRILENGEDISGLLSVPEKRLNSERQIWDADRSIRFRHPYNADGAIPQRWRFSVGVQYEFDVWYEVAIESTDEASGPADLRTGLPSQLVPTAPDDNVRTTSLIVESDINWNPRFNPRRHQYELEFVNATESVFVPIQESGQSVEYANSDVRFSWETEIPRVTKLPQGFGQVVNYHPDTPDYGDVVTCFHTDIIPENTGGFIDRGLFRIPIPWARGKWDGISDTTFYSHSPRPWPNDQFQNWFADAPPSRVIVRRVPRLNWLDLWIDEENLEVNVTDRDPVSDEPTDWEIVVRGTLTNRDPRFEFTSIGLNPTSFLVSSSPAPMPPSMAQGDVIDIELTFVPGATQIANGEVLLTTQYEATNEQDVRLTQRWETLIALELE